jgi:hypothetical protein
MTTSADRMFEERLQVALQDLADEVHPAQLLDRPLEARPRPQQARRTLLVTAAAVAALVVGIASAVWLRTDGPHLVEPVQHPPKVFRLSGLASEAPGRATMAVVLTDTTATPSGGPAYLVPATGGPVVALPSSAQASFAVLQRLSSDGRVVIRQNGGSVGAAFVLVDLASGRAQALDDDDALDLALSPDGGTAAEYTDDAVVLVDLGSGARHVLWRLANPLVAPLFGTGASGTETVVGSMGWSPDGSLLAVRDGPDILVLDRHGELRTRLRGAAMVNGSQSWSPDGRGLLVYDGHGPTFSVRHLDGTAPTILRAPRAAVRPLGWAGSRIVWLTGAAGAQRLVLADVSATHTETWMRFDVGAVSVESVTWSSALTGTVRR